MFTIITKYYVYCSNTATCNLANSDSDHSDWENEVVIQKIVEQSFVR